MAGRIPPTKRHGHDWNEATSSMQKCIRRADEEGALYWASELFHNGHAEYVWDRMTTIMSEDVGLAEPTLPASFMALRESYVFLKKRGKGAERLPLVHALLLLVRARKSRIVDHALIMYFVMEPPRQEPPDEAVDKHTIRGKRLGRHWEHFWDEGSLLRNKDGELNGAGDLDDRYRAAVIEHTLSGGSLAAPDYSKDAQPTLPSVPVHQLEGPTS
jgi:replication-associated recombination protein RarA